MIHTQFNSTQKKKKYEYKKYKKRKILREKKQKDGYYRLSPHKDYKTTTAEAMT